MKFDATIHLNLIKNQKYNIQETVFKLSALLLSFQLWICPFS